MATSQNPQNPGNINDINYYAKLQGEIEDSARSLNNLIASQRITGVEAANIRNTYRDLSKELKGLNALADQYNNDQLKTKDIAKSIVENERVARNLQIQKAKAIADGRQDLADTIEYEQIINSLISQELTSLKEANTAIDKRIGLTGKLIGSLKSLPVIGKLLNIEDAIKNMRLMAKEVGEDGKYVYSKSKIIGEGIKTSFEGLGKELTGAAALKFFYEAANKADEQTTKLAKSLMQTKGEATATREQFVGMANASGDAFINTDKLLEANAALGKQLGFNKVFSQDLDQTFVDLTKKINLSEEAAGGLARISIANGKTLKSTEQIIAATTSRISAQNGIQLDGKDILEESGKISGQLLANFKGNPAAIAEAVAQSKVLGTTLEQTKNQADKLLDFESSISNQLKAEVLTGKQLNLERARAAALQGDQVTVAKELASQGASFSEFTRMNVIQQRSLAEALGLSADQLSDQLLKQEAIGRSREEIVALGGEEAAQRLESLAAQDKFNAAVEKMKDLVGNLVAGPFGQLLDMVSDIAGIILKILAPFVSVIGAVIKPITGVLSGALGPLNTSLANTGFSSTGATTAGNNGDVVGALNDVKSAIVAGNNKQFGVNLDGRAVGTGVVRATYRSA
jgi:hypothetical protein